jgi:MtN3 and saliva related transmembrane protein
MRTEVFGLVGGTLTTLAFLPQVIKILQTKNTHSISLTMYLIYIVGVTCWLIYGILQNDTIIVGFNIGSVVLALMVIGCKIKYK